MSIFNQHFRHGMIKKYTTIIGSLLNGIDIVKYNAGGTEDSRVTVPVALSNKEKFIQRIMSDANLDRQPAITLPRIGFELSEMMYSPERKIQTRQQFAYRTADGNTYGVYAPVPYDFVYVAYIASKTQEEVMQIVEQIAPFFTPDFTVEMRASQVEGITFDVPITLDTVAVQDDATGSFEDRRVLVWSMTFLVKGFLFGPVKGNKNVIRHIDLTISDTGQLELAPELRNYIVDIDIEPYILGVALEDIKWDDDYDVVVTLTEDV